MKKKTLLLSNRKTKSWNLRAFTPRFKFQDFPIRNQKVTLCIKRRRWEVKPGNEIISRDWKLVQKGTQITSELAAF